MQQRRREADARFRARKRGEDVPKLKPGVEKGYKQTAEHVAKRKRFGRDHHAWVGDQVSLRSGRSRAERLYPDIGPCQRCGAAKAERHHRDGNTGNNDPTNIDILCRRCHMSVDGRLDRLRLTQFPRRSP